MHLPGLVSLGGTGRDDISMQFASRDFWPSWEAVKLKLKRERKRAKEGKR